MTVEEEWEKLPRWCSLGMAADFLEELPGRLDAGRYFHPRHLSGQIIQGGGIALGGATAAPDVSDAMRSGM